MATEKQKIRCYKNFDWTGNRPVFIEGKEYEILKKVNEGWRQGVLVKSDMGHSAWFASDESGDTIFCVGSAFVNDPKGTIYDKCEIGWRYTGI